MYFKLFKPQNWRKRSAEACRHHSAVLPKIKTPSAPTSRGRNFAVPPLACRLLTKTASTGALAPRARFQRALHSTSLLRQHRAIASARFDGSFSPILRFEKLEIHTVFLRFSNLGLAKNLSSNLLVELCGAALNQKFFRHGWSKTAMPEFFCIIARG